MSGYLAGKVWQSNLDSELKPLAAALADIANDDGTSIYPSVAYIAWLLGKSERSVQYGLKRLREKNVLAVVRKGGGSGKTTEYRLLENNFPRRGSWRASTNGNGATVAPLSVGKGATDGAKGCNLEHERVQPVAPEPSPSVSARERDAHAHPPSNGNREELHLEQDVLPWMEDVWRKHPKCQRRKWEDPKYPSSFERTEEFEGPEKFRQAFLDYLRDTKKPNILTFLYSRPKPPRRTYPGRRRMTAEEITGKSDVERLEELMGKKS